MIGTRSTVPTPTPGGEHRAVGGHHPDPHGGAQEAQAPVLLQGPGEEAGLGQDLEAVADARPPGRPSAAKRHRLHDRGEAGQGPGPQVVAVGETAGEHHGVEAGQVVAAVPDQLGPGPRATRPRPTTSCSQLVPGKTTTPTRAAISRSPSAAATHLQAALLDHRVGQQPVGQLLGLGAGRLLVVGLQVEADDRPARTPVTPSKPRAGSARSMVAPSGSAIPGTQPDLDAGRRTSLGSPGTVPVGPAAGPLIRS